VLRIGRLPQFESVTFLVHPHMIACGREADRRHHPLVPGQAGVEVVNGDDDMIELHGTPAGKSLNSRLTH
jgi:hypothetical protein